MFRIQFTVVPGAPAKGPVAKTIAAALTPAQIRGLSMEERVKLRSATAKAAQADIFSFQRTFIGILADTKSTVRKIFLAEGAYGGGKKWADLKEPYASRKSGKTKGRGLTVRGTKRKRRRKGAEKTFPGKTILRRTDLMFNSLTKQTEQSIQEITDTTLKYGTTVGYYKWHHKGRPKIMAKRQIFSAVIMKDIKKNFGIMAKFLAGGRFPGVKSNVEIVAGSLS